MKRLITILSCLLLATLLFGQTQWTTINRAGGKEPKLEIIEQSSSGLTVKLTTNAYGLETVETPRGLQSLLLSPEFYNSNDKGFPDLAHYAKSIVIPNSGTPNLQVLSSEYQLLSDVEIAPSKGTITRNINPADVPYEYGEVYDKDIFFPNAIASLSEPFIIRDCRGVSINYSPFVYNAYTKELKVYSEIIVKIEFTNNRGINELISTNEPVRDFNTVYKDMFINYNSSLRYTPLTEGSPGKILVICADKLAPAITKYVNWKREKGIETELVLMSKIGTTSAKLKTYIKNYYSNNAMTYVLLVGDHEGVPTTIVKNGGGGNNFPGSQGHNDLDSDNKYAYVDGNDNYADFFIGRFSGSTLAHIETQVNRTIHYEKSLAETDTWLGTCINTGSDEGTPKDDVLLNNIGAFLEPYGYTVKKIHQNGGSTVKMRAAINTGTGVINYTGHGNVNCWNNFPFNNGTVKSLENANKLPFVWSVACLNGQFRGSECFAEVWLQSKKNNKDIGAVAFLASTILQDWKQPTDGQREMNKLLVNSYENNVKRTIGGICFNGIYKMLEVHGKAGVRTADTWELFGDPSLIVRTKTPSEMNVVHTPAVSSSASNFTIQTDVEGALAAVSKLEDEEVVLLGHAYVTDGTATISLEEIGTASLLTLTVTAFDKISYQTSLSVEEGEVSEFYLGVSPLNLTFDATAGDETAKIITNVNWTATSSEDWLTVSPASGNANATLTLTATDHTGDVARTAKITFSGDNGVASKIINVTQNGVSIPDPEDPIVPSEDGLLYVFTYDFESCENFVLDQFSPCTTHDGDGIATYSMSDGDFLNEGYVGAFIAFNPSATTPALNNKSIYAPIQGKKYGACFNAKPVGGVESVNNDWFITPAIKLQNNSMFSFFAKTVKDFGLERFNVLVSTTTNDITSFTKVSTGEHVKAPLSWTKFEYDLSAYNNQQVYIAIQCVSSDSFMFLIDDLEVICTPSDSEGHFLNTSTTNLSFEGEGGNKTINVTANVAWSITSSETWLSVNPASGNGNATISITASANTGTKDRTAKITLSGENGVATKFIDVVQTFTSLPVDEGTMTVNPDNLLFQQDGGTEIITIKSNVEWSVETNKEWLTINPAKGSNNGDVTVTASANLSSEDRVALITVSGGNGVDSKTIEVKQRMTTSIFENNGSSYLNVFPNPSTDYIEISSNLNIQNIQIINVLGEIVITQDCYANQIKLSVSNLPSAHYIVKAISENGDVLFKKIIVQ